MPESPSSVAASQRHRAYGLRFGSDFLLPELPLDESGEAPDVAIQLGEPLSLEEVARLTAPDAPIENTTRFENGWAQMLFSGVGRFTIDNGRRILVEPVEGTVPSTWRLPLLGAIMALLLEQRGLFALHGGAAVLRDGAGNEVAAGFLGEKGQGKSTLGAALSKAGFSLLCDDVLAVSFSSSDKLAPPLALSGFANLKLLPEAVKQVWEDSPENFALVAPELAGMDKRQVPARLAPDARTLRHLFVLSSLEDVDEAHTSAMAMDEGADVALSRLSAQEALAWLVPHTFGARFGDLYLSGARRGQHFQACARLVSQCAVWKLARRRDLSLLPQTIAAIEDAVRGTSWADGVRGPS